MPDVLPEQLEFHLGGWCGASNEIEFKQGALHYHVFLGGPLEIITPTPEAWARFWQETDAAGVWRWQKSYFDEGVLDGMQWSLKLKHQGRHVSCEGSNAYPGGGDGPEYSTSGEFAQFLKALRALTGKKEIC